MPLASRTFDQLINFTRTTAGTYVDSTGKIASTPASRNLLTFTQEFDNAAWVKANATVSANVTTAPDGTQTADKVNETATTAEFILTRTPTLAPSTTYTFSCYMKAAERSFGVLNIYTGTASCWTWFNLSTGVVSTLGSGATATITAVGDGWYRCTLTIATAASGTPNVAIFPAATNGVTFYAGTAGSGIFIWGAQLEQASAATTYTRNYGGLFPPRFDYDPVTLAPKGLLIEEQRTNLALTSTFATLAGSAGSQYPSGTGWLNYLNTGGTRTFVASSVFAGSQAMDIASVSAARNFIGFSFTPSASTTYTVSFYVESVSGATGIVAYATGTLGTGGSTNNVTAPTTTGRYSYTFTTGTAPGTVDLRFGIGCSTNESGSIRISNVQCEAGAFATSYIPTVASQVTRTADVATITGANFSQWFNAAEGSFVVEAVTPTTGSYAAYISNGNETDYLGSRFGSSGTAFVTATGGALQANIGTTAGTAKIAAAYKANDFAVSVNGGAVATDTAGTVPTVNQMRLGAAFAGGVNINGHIRSIKYFPTRLSNTQLQALTA